MSTTKARKRDPAAALIRKVRAHVQTCNHNFDQWLDNARRRLDRLERGPMTDWQGEHLPLARAWLASTRESIDTGNAAEAAYFAGQLGALVIQLETAPMIAAANAGLHGEGALWRGHFVQCDPIKRGILRAMSGHDSRPVDDVYRVAWNGSYSPRREQTVRSRLTELNRLLAALPDSARARFCLRDGQVIVDS